MKSYRLLRNNKESGPYSAEDLIRMGLKPYDLVWVEGKSASWRYPSEVDEFKPYAPAVEEQPFDRFYKKPAAMKVAKEETPAQNTTLYAIPGTAVQQPKPRIRIKADVHKIDVPVPYPQLRKEPAQSLPVQNTAVTPDWKDMWLNWEAEKKAVRDANKVNVATTMRSEKFHSTATKEKDEVLETKFSQSLDEIKDQYIETVLNKSKNKNSIAKRSSFITAAVLIIAILAMGVWLGFKWSGKSTSVPEHKIVNTQPQSTEQTVAQNENSQSNNNTDNASQNNQNESAAVSTIQQPNSDEVTHVIQVPVIKKTSTAAVLKSKTNSNKSSFQKTFLQKDSYTSENLKQPSVNDVQAHEAVDNSYSAPVMDAHETAISKFKKSEPKIGDYISVDPYMPSATSAVGVKFKIQNVSDIPVDLVMMDLQYYDTNGRFEKGETVYVRNISAGQTITIAAPDNNQAAKVNYKISMVSSEKNNLYLIAD